jgi:acyl-homoserine lactone acylase PvdQ
MPGEYAALGKVFGPEDWRVTDIVSTAALVGGIFGKGGGGELDSALVLQESQRRFGRTRGRGVWSDFRSAEDPEAPTTVASRRFSYQAPARRVRPGSTAMPDRGSVRPHPIVSATTGGAAATRAERPGARATGGTPGRSPLAGMLEFPTAASNALLVSARESESGHPIAVMGPQTGYFNPQILTEVDLHGPSIDARGATFVGVSLYVQLGRGRDYAFSATSASQDNTDTFALDLCEPGGAAPSIGSTHYRYRGACRPIEVVTQTNAWQSNLADSTPAGTQTLRAERTKLGLVTARATVRGRPVIYTKLRSTYMHEVDSARGFSDFNNPQSVRSAADFQRAAAKIGYTFNWFYADDRDIAYFNSGDNPLRAPNVDQSLPVAGRFEWQGFDPERVTARYTPFGRHPQTINQSYLTSWNNKQARGYRAADSNFGFSPIYRSLLLDSRIRRGIRGSAKMSLVELIDAMEDAGTVDLRGDRVLPYALRVIGRPRDARLRRAVDTLAEWVRSGAHRRDRDRNGVYEHSEAVRIMDAWWPRLVAAQFRPALGRSLFERLSAIQGIDNEPNNHGGHLGSAYQGGWYGYSQKDLRMVLGRAGRRNLRGLRGAPARGARYSRAYCGGDFRARASRRAAVRLRRCRAALTASLSEALTIPAARLYRPDPICDAQPGLGPADPGRKPGDQLCFDAVWMRALGAAQQPVFHWINRPTFQQAVEVQGRVGR